MGRPPKRCNCLTELGSQALGYGVCLRSGSHLKPVRRGLVPELVRRGILLSGSDDSRNFEGRVRVGRPHHVE